MNTSTDDDDVPPPPPPPLRAGSDMNERDDEMKKSEMSKLDSQPDRVRFYTDTASTTRASVVALVSISGTKKKKDEATGSMFTVSIWLGMICC